MAQHLMAQLERASKALDKKPAAALQALVDAWSERPLPELAAVVERFEAAHPPPAFDGDTKAFTTLAKKPSATELGALTRAIVAPKTADTIARLEALTAWRDDPRVSGALLDLVKLVPWTSNGARPVWTKTFELITRIADPRFLERAPSLPAEWKFRENQREWMQLQLRRAVEAVTTTRTKTPVAPLTKVEAKALEALAARLTPRPTSPPRDDGATLLAAIYANPDDDAARLVYADWCLERADPRGEFISLQFKPDKSKAELKREAELQKKHGAQWLGPLAKVTLKDVTFRRGFPSKVVARFKGQRDVEQFGEAPEWATIEDLSWSLPGAWSSDEAQWVEYLPKRVRPRSLVVHGHAFARLLESKTPWAIERLTVTARDVEAVRRFASSPLFPKVTWLRVDDAFPHKLLTQGWLAAVADLGIHTHSADAVLSWARAMTARERFTVEQHWAGTFEFSRGADGALSKLHVLVPPGREPRTLNTVNTLPEGFLTAATAEGATEKLTAALATRVRKPGAKAPVVIAEETTPLRFLAAHQRGAQWVVVEKNTFFVVDGRGEVLDEVPINEANVAAFSPDGKTVACAWDRRLEWRDGVTGALVKKEDVGQPILNIRWTRAGDRVVLHLDKHLEVRAWPSGTVERTVKSGQYPKKPSAVVLSEDGAWLIAAQHSGDVHVHGPGMKKPAIFTPPKFAGSLAFVSEHEVVLGCGDEVLRRYDVRAPAQPLSEAPAPEYRRLVQSADGRRIALSALDAYVDGDGARVFDAESLRQLLAIEGACKVLAFSGDGAKLLTSDGKKLQVHAVK